MLWISPGRDERIDRDLSYDGRDFSGWARHPDGILEATVKADAFCHNTVRALVGAMLFVGDGPRPPGWPGKVLAGGVRDSAVHVVRPHRLTLEEVGYPTDSGPAARNLASRNKRTLPGGSGCC